MELSPGPGGDYPDIDNATKLMGGKTRRQVLHRSREAHRISRPLVRAPTTGWLVGSGCRIH